MSDKEERIAKGQQALNLLNEGLMAEIIPAHRRSVLENLAKADPADTNKIIRLQAEISVIDELRETLKAFLVDAEDLTRDVQSYP